MRYLRHCIVTLLIFTLAGCGVDKTPPSNSEIIGTYFGRYGGGIETFEIRVDGTFNQTFQVGTNLIYDLKGKWKMDRGQIIAFEPFMIPKEVLREPSDKKLENGSGEWSRNPIHIDFGPWPYGAVKVKGEGALTSPPRQ